MIRRRAWCERGEQTDFDALVQHVFGHGAIGCPFPARDGNQPAWADQHSVFAADFFRVFALFVVGWPHQWPQPDPATDRKSVVSGKSVSVRVDRGGRRNIKKTKHRTKSQYPK